MRWIYDQEVRPEINKHYTILKPGRSIIFSVYRRNGWHDAYTDKRVFSSFYIGANDIVECGGEAFYTWEAYENAYPLAKEYRHYMKSKTGVQYIVRGAGYPSLLGGYLSLCIHQNEIGFYIRVSDADDMEWESEYMDHGSIHFLRRCIFDMTPLYFSDLNLIEATAKSAIIPYVERS